MNKFEYVEVLSTEPVYKYILHLLSDHLSKGEDVLWLLSGGSAIGIETQIAGQLPATGKLTVALIDERYGPVGHRDSNWQQLEESGFRPTEAKMIPVIEGKGLKETVEDYSHVIADLLDKSDFIVAIAGIGSDGHTLGIKPGSPSVKTDKLVIGYNWDDYCRITTTAQVIKKCDKIVVYAAGAEKKVQLEKLKDELPANEQPAQLLKLCRDVTIFTDQKI